MVTQLFSHETPRPSASKLMEVRAPSSVTLPNYGRRCLYLRSPPPQSWPAPFLPAGRARSSVHQMGKGTVRTVWFSHSRCCTVMCKPNRSALKADPYSSTAQGRCKVVHVRAQRCAPLLGGNRHENCWLAATPLYSSQHAAQFQHAGVLRTIRARRALATSLSPPSLLKLISSFAA